ncbi:MAG TPA: hypothetical protein DGR79_04300 [Clostridiales bacterium]|nr:hypothetical protein [Clostridiales bacterium]
MSLLLGRRRPARENSEHIGLFPRSRTERNRRRRGRRIARMLAFAGLALVGLALVAAAALYVFLGGLTNPVHFVSLAEAVPGTRVNILVMGLDAPLDRQGRAVPDFDIHRAEGSRTDTMMLVSVDTTTADVGILALPRDTRVIISGREDFGYDKLGHAHAYPDGGPEALIATVSEFLDVPIHYYVRVNSAGVARIIDLLGGVEVYVEEDMYYVDPWQDLVIDIKAGLQVLDGEKAVGYLRYRGGKSDVDRIERQQRFLEALKHKLFSLGAIAKVPSLIAEIADCVDTNMTPGEMLSYARLAMKVDMPKVRMGVLPGDIETIQDPGRPPLSYYVVREDECAELVDILIWGVDREANAEITVEVLNGTEVPGLAGLFAAELRRQGFDVVSVADADRHDLTVTEIIDRSRDDDKLRRLSQAVLRYTPLAELGRARAVRGRPEFTVIVGQDYVAYVESRGGESTGD